MGKVRIEIKDGKMNVETFGFKGKSCAKATEILMNIGNVLKDEKKKEWWEDNVEINTTPSDLCG